MNTSNNMRRPVLILTCAALLAVSASTMVPALRARWVDTQVAQQPAQSAYALLEARPYRLDQSYVSYDRAEQPEVFGGWALVLRVPAESAVLHNGLMPVLCVGDTTAERWNSGGPSGQIVVTVPCELDEAGMPVLDLAAAPIWFAAAELPERVDAAWITAERERASEELIAPLPAAEIANAIERAGAPLHVADHSALARELSLWVERYSPEEAEYARGLRGE